MGAPSDMGAGSRPRLGVPFQVNARYRAFTCRGIVDQVDLQCANVILGLPYSVALRTHFDTSRCVTRQQLVGHRVFEAPGAALASRSSASSIAA
jgi:hypothetical protein